MRDPELDFTVVIHSMHPFLQKTVELIVIGEIKMTLVQRAHFCVNLAIMFDSKNKQTKKKPLRVWKNSLLAEIKGSGIPVVG